MGNDNGQTRDVDPLQVRARLTLPQVVAVFLAGIGFAGMQTAIYTELRALRSDLAAAVTHDQWSRWESAFREQNEAKGIRVPYMNQMGRPAPTPTGGHASY